MIPLTVLGLLRFIFVKENPAIDAQQVKDKVNFKDIWTMVKKNSVLYYLLCSFFCKFDYRFPDFAIYILPV